MTDLALILGAVVLAAAGGEAFLKSILGAAIHLRVPKIVVATTLAAFATSSPELTVSTVAALAGQPEIGLGDALGSNVVNMALVFGLALLFRAVQTTRQDFGNSFALALAAPVLTFVLVLDGRIERADALLLLAIFLVWVVWTVRCALRQREVAVYIEATELSAGKSLLLGVLGLGALIAAGRLFVSGATGVAAAFAVDTYVIGVVLVAVGTSLPELVTVILSRLCGQDDVGVGTLLGSNLFNGLAIVGIAGTIGMIVPGHWPSSTPARAHSNRCPPRRHVWPSYLFRCHEALVGHWSGSRCVCLAIDPAKVAGMTGTSPAAAVQTGAMNADLFPVVAALAKIEDGHLYAMIDAVDELTPSLPGGLAAWLRHILDWEAGRRQGYDRPLRSPWEAIDDSERVASIATAIALCDGFALRAAADAPVPTALLATVVNVLVGGATRH
ncbi:MAG: sodium:calcium antiporter [Betaproteobacteria bacterium]|nr:sodium:calcium antiporter [Betaproteobacteria bacterium]